MVLPVDDVVRGTGLMREDQVQPLHSPSKRRSECRSRDFSGLLERFDLRGPLREREEIEIE